MFDNCPGKKVLKCICHKINKTRKIKLSFCSNRNSKIPLKMPQSRGV